MVVTRPLAFMALAACVAVLATACSMVEPEPLDPPVVNLVSIEPEAMGLNAQVFCARLRLFNPNSVPLRVSSGELQLELGGERAARGRTLAPFAVDAGAESEVDVRITMNLLRDAPALFRVLQGGGAEGLEYALTGHVNVERRGRDRVPIAASGRLAPPAALRPSAAPQRGAGTL
jgi:LEA14-like dessication related protein